MRLLPALMLIVSPLSAFSQTQIILETSEYVTATYTAYQLPDSSGETDRWRITVSLANYATGNLYYGRTDQDLANLNTIPHYLKVDAPNASAFKADVEDVAAKLIIATSSPANDQETLSNSIFFYGTSTMIASTNGTNIFVVKPVKIQKSFTVTVKEGERPEIRGEFVRKLLPLDKMDLKKKRK